jgi:predicted amidohydrolase
MRVAAFTLAGIDLSSVEAYSKSLTSQIKASGAELAVLPAYSFPLLAISTGLIEPTETFSNLLTNITTQKSALNNIYLDLHAKLARHLGIYLVPGSYFESKGSHHYHSSCCFDRQGNILAVQCQTHLTREERECGLARGSEFNLFDLGDMKAGLIIGNDARHPEAGRNLALRGADIIICCGALETGFNCWPQVAGIWAQVQQNQFWAVEAQLCGSLAGRSFGATPAVHGPCEITPGQSGFLARKYPHSVFATADLDEPARKTLKKQYPLLELLNPAAYGELKAKNISSSELDVRG